MSNKLCLSFEEQKCFIQLKKQLFLNSGKSQFYKKSLACNMQTQSNAFSAFSLR